MEFSVRSFAVVSLLLLVSLSTDMSGPLVVDAILCEHPNFCDYYCSLLGKPACCPIGLTCRCSSACPRSFPTEITEEVMAGATDKEPFIKKIVIA